MRLWHTLSISVIHPQDDAMMGEGKYESLPKGTLVHSTPIQQFG